MDFIQLSKQRYSCRNYMDTPVSKEVLDKILEAGRIAPTAANRQPQKILVIQSEEGLQKVKDAANIHGGPVCLMVCTEIERAWKNPYNGKQTIDVDPSIITTCMMMEATELGLGTVYMTYFDEALLRKNFQVPKEYEIVNLLVLGYPDSTHAVSNERFDTARKRIEETVFYEHF